MSACSLRTCTLLLFLLFSFSLLACGDNPGNQSTNAPASAQTPSEPPAYEGYYDIANCNAILAWAWDTNRPEVPVKLDIYDGDKLIATVTADAFREDLLASKRGNGKHGMFYPTPPQLKDGKPHVLRIKFAGTNVELKNGPKEINCKFNE